MGTPLSDLSRAALTASLKQSLETALAELTALPTDQRLRPLKPSRANPDIRWTPCDHFAHLIGVEQYFNQTIEQALAEPPVATPPLTAAPNRSREEAMAAVHALNDQWILKQRDKTFEELAAMARAVRAQTLALLERLTDDQLALPIPVPWGTATVAEIFALYVRHTDMHLGFIRTGLSAPA
ncbi:MAG: DinB family protein [Chloracidobacterium sp.]|nr:DinB family protein [Chloracidobacterium sp.]MDW8218605.1 DinB family protein [Acidobacteriota bacterium]